MNIKSILASVCLTTSGLLSFSIPTHAITISLTSPTASTPSNGLSTNVAGATTIDFNATASSYPGSASSSEVTYSGGQVVAFSGESQNNLNLSYAPYNDTSRYLDTGTYYGSNPGKASDVTITFTQPVAYFGMYWGLINASNTVTFYNANNNIIGSTITGTTLKNQDSTINIEQSGVNGSRYVDFFADQGEAFSKIVLRDTSNSNGFETDNHAYKRSIPFQLSPGLGLLMLGAWGAGIGLRGKMKNNSTLSKLLFNKPNL